MNNNYNTFYVIKEDGIRTNASILSKLNLNGNDYIAYTFNEINENDMIKIYVTGIINEGNTFSFREIVSDSEWNDIKELLKTIARDENEEFPSNIKSNLKLIGEEVSIRRPKKLLVSQKFANVLSSKYEENQEIEESSIITDLLNNIETNGNVEKEETLEKTIKIPTFEELQARSKNIQAVMETAKETAPVNVAMSNESIKSISVPDLNEIDNIEEKNEHPVYESRVKKVDYEAQFKKDIEPVLLDVYAKQQKHIEELEEELSKTKFDLFEKQKEALSLSNEKAEMERRSNELEDQLNGVQAKMNGILEVLQGNQNKE